MCGRYSIRKPVTKTTNLVKTNIKVEDTDNYNAHPTQKLPIIKSYTNGKALELCEFGYCLLYTSPSPRDGLLSRMPSSA